MKLISEKFSSFRALSYFYVRGGSKVNINYTTSLGQKTYFNTLKKINIFVVVKLFCSLLIIAATN